MAQFTGMGIDLSKGVAASYDLDVKLKLPQSIGAGISFKATPQFRISAEAEWINWSNAFDNMTLTLSNGNNVNVNKMLGNTGNFEILFPLTWKDSYNIRFGGEYDLGTAFTIRAGYSYGSNPVPQGRLFSGLSCNRGKPCDGGRQLQRVRTVQHSCGVRTCPE